MEWKWINVLMEAEERNKRESPIYFIAHLLDRILVGQICDKQDYPMLRDAAEQDRILELHIFNNSKEIFVVWENDRVVRYADLKHRDHGDYVEYEYELDERYSYEHRNPSFKSVVTRTYIEKDDDPKSAMPRIGQAVLYELK